MNLTIQKPAVSLKGRRRRPQCETYDGSSCRKSAEWKVHRMSKENLHNMLDGFGSHMTFTCSGHLAYELAGRMSGQIPAIVTQVKS